MIETTKSLEDYRYVAEELTVELLNGVDGCDEDGNAARISLYDSGMVYVAPVEQPPYPHTVTTHDYLKNIRKDDENDFDFNDAELVLISNAMLESRLVEIAERKIQKAIEIGNTIDPQFFNDHRASLNTEYAVASCQAIDTERELQLVRERIERLHSELTVGRDR